MNTDQTDPRFAPPRDLAGAHYEDMMRSKEAAMAYLSVPDYKVRLGAILICDDTWKAVSEPSVVNACRAIAQSDADDATRFVGIGALARGLNSTKDRDASVFLAKMVMDSQNSMELRIDAYWALRHIQFGPSDVDFDTFLRGTIHTVKIILEGCPGKFSEEAVRSALLPEGRFPEGFWESSDQIDWDFVHRISKLE